MLYWRFDAPKDIAPLLSPPLSLSLSVCVWYRQLGVYMAVCMSELAVSGAWWVSCTHASRLATDRQHGDGSITGVLSYSLHLPSVITADTASDCGRLPGSSVVQLLVVSFAILLVNLISRSRMHCRQQAELSAWRVVTLEWSRVCLMAILHCH